MKTRIFIAINLILILSSTLFAQCSPGVRNNSGALVASATFCEGELISFEANSPGYTTTTSWDFSSVTSSQQNPSYSFTTAGNYTVTFTGSGPAGTCTETLSITVKPSPDIYVTNLTSDSQCFKGNTYCIKDVSESSQGNIIHQTYRISNGMRIDYPKPSLYGTNQQIDTTLCINLSDPTGGSFDLIVQTKDANGCIAQKEYQDMFYVKPKIGAEFTNTTAAPNPGCGSTLGTFQNISSTPLASVDSFIWDFGDGTLAYGNSDSTALWASVSHLYETNGSFSVKLTVFAYDCVDEFTYINAVSNVVLNPQIESNGDVHYEYENPLPFTVTNLPSTPGIDQFLWNFGDPSSGPVNFNNQDINPKHNYKLGPWMVSARMIVGPCDVTVYDTITVIGPKATIEVPFDRIPQSEKNQCGTNDSVHFTNNSTFYQNDSNPNDEDSTIIVNGKTQFAFNSGDQTSLASAAHLTNRTMGSQVVRIWDFGDEYAPQCTTSTAKNWNIGVNCNFSEDEFPVHKYQSWDSIYHKNYFNPNDSFGWTKYNDSTKTCYIEQVDTNNASKHREIFNKTIPKVYKATLWLRDTVQNSESADTVTIDLRKPDASKMKLVSGTPCPYNSGISEYVLEFDINTDGHSYFAVNFDSLAYGTTGFTPYNQGVLAPPAPGSPIPFQLPYSVRGDLRENFVKGYSQAGVGPANLRNPRGSFTMGLIVGNGPVSGGQPTCVDTAWYPDIFRIPTLDSDFEIISPSAIKKTICAGKEAYFDINTLVQNNIEVLRWNWGYPGNIGRGPQFDVYVEQFTYLEQYNGPSPTRNDKDISYNGEDWLYNYVVRSTINDATGATIIDTIVTSIVKDWKLQSTVRDAGITSFDVKEVLGYSEIPESEYYKLFGDGTFGCIDTTGLSQLITIEKSEYKNYNGDHTYMLGDRRYRYTNVAQTDSVEVAHVLHFRDSSLQGYDTLIVGTDTTAGVWKHEYTYQEMVNGVSIRRAANGPMTPTLSLTNTTSCTSNSATYLNVGFLNEYTVQEKEICEGLPIILDYYQRYYQYGEEDRNTYPINDFALWQDFARYSNNIETYETDWDSTDGVWDAERNIIPNHQYSDPGDYTISVVTKDSNNCRDTVYLNVSISKLEPHFGYDVTNVNCASIYNFIDSTEVYGDDDEILAWEWDFGDRTRRSILQNPSHQYTSGGYFDVKLKTWTALGCRDSITRRLYIPGPQPEFEFDIGIWPLDTLSICVGDTIGLKNISGGDLNTPKFLMDWGDGTFTTPPGIGSFYKHQYTKAGTYELFLTQEDEIPGTGNRCSRIFPDTNLDLLHQHRMVVLVKEKPDVRIGGRIAPTYQRHPTSFLADVDRRYTRYHWYIQGDTILKFAPDSQLIYKFQDVGIFNVILAPQYDVLPRCWDRDTIQMEVLARHLNPVQERESEISVYPNPGNEEVFVTLPEGLKLLDITAIDMAGKEIQVRYTFESGNQIQVNTSDLASGNYQFKIETDTGVIHKKIVILQE